MSIISSRPHIKDYFGVIRRKKLLSSLQCREQINYILDENGKEFTLRGMVHLKPPTWWQPNADSYLPPPPPVYAWRKSWVSPISQTAPCGLTWHEFESMIESYMTDMRLHKNNYPLPPVFHFCLTCRLYLTKFPWCPVRTALLPKYLHCL